MKLSLLAILLGLICITATVIINYNMSIEYNTAGGKTQALFGLKHIERYYVGIIGLFGLSTSLYAMNRKEKKSLVIIAILISLISIIITFLELWRWMI